MAGKNNQDIGTVFKGDSSGFEKATQEVGASIKQVRKDIKDTASTISSFGSAIGDVGQSIGNTISKILTATGPIGLLVAAIGTIVGAWKDAQEGIEDYLKSADRVKYGAGAFTQDAKKAQKETVSRAESGFLAGSQLVNTTQATEIRLKIEGKLTEELKKQLEAQILVGNQMMSDNSRLLQSVQGVEGKWELFGNTKVTWQQKYNSLLLSQGQLDREKIDNETKVKGLQTDLAELAYQIRLRTTDTADRQKLLTEYEDKAKQIKEIRLGLLDKEGTVTEGLLRMTGKDQELKMHGLHEDQERAQISLDYAETIKATSRMQNKIDSDTDKANKKAITDAERKLTLLDRQLKNLKEQNTTIEQGYKFGQKNIDIGTLKNPYVLEEVGKANIKQLKFNAPSASAKGTQNSGLSPYTGITADELKAYKAEEKFQEQLAGTKNIVEGLQNTFAEMFTSISSGSKTAFQDMAKAFERSIEQMAIQMAAKAAIFGILTLLSGGTGLIGELAGGLLGGKKLGQFMGFAEGTNYTPGGLSLVGEHGPEIVNLPKGAQVIPNNKLGSQAITLTLKGRFDGKDIYFANQNYQIRLSQNT